MPTTTTIYGGSPHSLIVKMEGTGGVSTSLRAAVLAACAPGPLKELLTRTADWTVFNLGSAGARLIQVREVLHRSSETGGIYIDGEILFQAAALKCDCNGTCQFEIRLQHTERL
jgi:hypothetical protein